MAEQDFKTQFDTDPEFKSHFLALPESEQAKVIEAFRTGKDQLNKLMTKPQPSTQLMGGAPGSQPKRTTPNNLDTAMPYVKPAMGAMLGAGIGGMLPAAASIPGAMATQGAAGVAGSTATDVLTGEEPSALRALMTGGLGALVAGIPGMSGAFVKGNKGEMLTDALHAKASPLTFLLKKILGRGAAAEAPTIATPPTLPNAGGINPQTISTGSTLAPGAGVATPPIVAPNTPATLMTGGNTLGAMTRPPVTPPAAPRISLADMMGLKGGPAPAPPPFSGTPGPLPSGAIPGPLTPPPPTPTVPRKPIWEAISKSDLEKLPKAQRELMEKLAAAAKKAGAK